MTRTLLLLLGIALPASALADYPAPVSTSPAASATARADESGWALRPMTGSVAEVSGPLPTAQLMTGIDAEYRMSQGSSLVLGLWGATAEGYISAEAHVDFKYRIFGLSPLVLPSVTGGIGYTWGFPRAGKDRNTATAVGIRTGV